MANKKLVCECSFFHRMLIDLQLFAIYFIFFVFLPPGCTYIKERETVQCLFSVWCYLSSAHCQVFKAAFVKMKLLHLSFLIAGLILAEKVSVHKSQQLFEAENRDALIPINEDQVNVL